MRRSLLAFALFGSLSALAQAEGTPAVERVLVIDVKPIDADAEDVASLPAAIEKEIARHPGYAVISREKLAATVTSAGGKDAAACFEDAGCVGKVATEMKAGLVIGGSLEKKRKGYVLSLKLADPKKYASADTASESMKKLSSLPLNVPIVLDKLFKWDDPPVPPPEFELPPDDAPDGGSAPPTAAAMPPVIPRSKRVAIFAIATDHVDADEVKPLPELIAKELGRRKGYVAVDVEEMKKALEKVGAKDGHACAEDKNCMAHVADATHADLVMTGAVRTSKGKYVLQLNLSAPGAEKGSRVSESMKRLSSLPMNVPICLDSLLD